jgi:hypothetical protein
MESNAAQALMGDFRRRARDGMMGPPDGSPKYTDGSVSGAAGGSANPNG